MFRINKYRPSKVKRYGKVKESQFSEKTTEQGVQYTLGNIRYQGRIINEEITEMTVFTRENGHIESIWFEVSNPKYDWDKGYFSFMVYYRARKTNWDLSYEERKAEEHEHLLFFLKEAIKYFKEEGLDVNVKILDDDCNEIAMEEFDSSLATTTEETETEETETEETETEETETEGSETMTEKTGYDKETVLLETGEFKVDGETFTYEGEPITVGDVLDTSRVEFDLVGSDYKGRFLLLSTGHILCRCSHYSIKLNYTTTYDEIVYAPTFSEIYPTASDFIESRIELLNTYQPTKEFQEKVDYCSYKGRLFKDLVKMTAEELVAIDNEEAGKEIPASDVKAYVEYLNEEGQKPSTWMEGVTITEELVDYHIRHNIERGIDKCEKYCSPSVEFFRLAEQFYKNMKIEEELFAEDPVEEPAEPRPKNEIIENCITLCRKELDVHDFFSNNTTNHIINGEFIDSLRDEIIDTLVSIYVKLGHQDLSEEDREKIDKVYGRICENWEIEKAGVRLHRCIGYNEAERLLNTLEEVYNNY